MDPTNMDQFVRDIQNKLNEKADEKAQSIDKMFKSNLISPRSYKNRKEQVQTWKQRKRKEIKKTEKQLMLGWKQANNLIDQIRLSSKSIIVEGNNTCNKQEQKQDPFKLSNSSATVPITPVVDQPDMKEEDQVSELIQIQQSYKDFDQAKDEQNQKQKFLDQRDYTQQPKQQPTQLLDYSGNTQQINSITAIAAIALLDDSSRLAQSGQIKDDMMSSNRGFFSSLNRKNEISLDKPSQYDSKDRFSKTGPMQVQQDQQPCKPSFKAISELKIQQMINEKNSLDKSHEQNKNIVDIFSLPEGINYEKKDSADNSSEQTTFRRLNQEVPPAAPPYTPQYVSQDQSNAANYERNDLVDSKPQNTQRESQNSNADKHSPTNSYQSQINENMLLIPDKLKGMHIRTDSDNMSQSPGALVSISANDQQLQTQQIKKQQQSKPNTAEDNQPQQKKSRNKQSILDMCTADSINSNQSDLQSDYQKISDLVAAQLMQIYIEDTIQCCIFKILGLDLEQNQAPAANASAIFQSMRQPNVENTVSALFQRIRGGQQQSKHKGIKTDVQLVKKYITRIKQNISENVESLIQNLSTPLFRDPLVTLAHLQNYQYRGDGSQQGKQQSENAQEDESHLQQQDDYEQREGAADIIMAQQSVLHIDLYLDIERRRKDQHLLDWAHDLEEVKKEKEEVKKEIEDGQNKSEEAQMQRINQNDKDGKENEQDQAQFFARQWENIHNKAIFDALNEAFDSFRPFGLRGPPLPWSKKLRTLKETKIDKDHFGSVFKQVNDKVVQWASTRAGAIKLRIPQDLDGQDEIEQKWDKLPLFTRQEQQERLNQVRQQKLAIMLAQQVDENESLWLDYEYEETQVMLDLTDMILEQLGGETANLLQLIEKKKMSRREGKQQSQQDESSNKIQSE